MSTNEPIISHRRAKSSSNRSFGLLFAGLFAAIAAGPLLSGGGTRWWAAGIAVFFLALALVVPQLLAPVNYMWFRLALLLNRIVAPVVMGLIFAIVIVPAALLLKMMGKDLLHLNWQPDAVTYWIQRAPPAPQPKSMSQQF
jgi:hypothetical protein